MTELTPLIKQFIQKHEHDNINELALKARSYSDIDMPFVIQQIKGRQIAKSKLPLWYNHTDIIYPPILSMEQCSSEQTARYKQNLTKGDNFIDLTGGFGVDFSFMAQDKKKAYYVELQENLIEIVSNNLKALNINNCQIIKGDGSEYIKLNDKIWDTIYLDPARRDMAGHKTVMIEDCTPNLLELDKILNRKSNQTIIKLSPMLDISQAINALTKITEVHIISVNNECKELLLVKEKLGVSTKFICANLTNNETSTFSFTKAEEHDAVVEYTDTPEVYLYEPNSSIMKAGCFKYIGQYFGIKKLHPNSHLYTSDKVLPDFPGRRFIVKKVLAPSKKDLKKHLQYSKANISTRNYPFSVADIRKQTKIKEGGNDYIFATTLACEKKVLILCEKLV